MDLTTLPDSDLVRKFLAAQDPLVAEELARRCLPKIRKMARRFTGFCPPSEDRNAFLDDVVSLASEKLLKCLRKYPENFEAWLTVVVSTSALDYRDHLLRRASAHAEPIETAEAAGKLRSIGPRIDVPASVYQGEIEGIVKQLLLLHAEEKETSAITVWLMARDHRVSEIATLQGCAENTVRKLLDHDYLSLRLLLRRRFKIDRIGDMLKE